MDPLKEPCSCEWSLKFGCGRAAAAIARAIVQCSFDQNRWKNRKPSTLSLNSGLGLQVFVV